MSKTRLAMDESAVRISPSVLSADFGRLADEIREVEAAGADSIHVDVMDGRFVPNITVGLPVVKAVRAATELPVDVHLMIVEPEKYVERFADAGADCISVHVEACTHVQRTLTQIRGLGKRAGLAFNPHTPEHALQYLLDELDYVMLMTVNPGYSGQRFIPSQLAKIARVRRLLQDAPEAVDIEVDGGISSQTIADCTLAGANIFVAGNAVFGQADRQAAIAALRQASCASRSDAATPARG